MTKIDLIKEVAKKTGFRREDVAGAIDAAFETIQQGLEAGDYVLMGKLGRLVVAERGERNGVNPSTGEKIVIPAKKVVKFKASASLKEAIN